MEIWKRSPYVQREGSESCAGFGADSDVRGMEAENGGVRDWSRCQA